MANPLSAKGGLGGAGKLTELRHRLLFVVGALVVFRIGAHIPIPGIDPVALAALFDQQKGTIIDMFNMFSGGALKRLTVFALGVMPYISASIIFQLLGSIVPSLEQLKKEGEAGRRKITEYTRYATAGLAAFQALGIAIALEGQKVNAGAIVVDPGWGFRMTAVVTLVTGTMFLVWLGEQVTERGVGNGISSDHILRHHCRSAGGHRRYPGAGPHRRAARVHRVVPVCAGHRRDLVRGLHGAGSAAYHGQLRQATAGPAHVCGPDQPSAP